MLYLCCICTAGIQTSSKHTWGHQIYGGHPNIWECLHIFRGHPNIGVPKYTGSIQTYGTSKHTGVHPNKWGASNILRVFKQKGASKHAGDVKACREHPNVWGIWTPPQSDKACFFLLYIYCRHPNIFQPYRGHPNIGLPKLTGGIQTYWELPDKQVLHKHIGASKQRECPNIQGGIQT